MNEKHHQFVDFLTPQKRKSDRHFCNSSSKLSNSNFFPSALVQLSDWLELQIEFQFTTTNVNVLNYQKVDGDWSKFAMASDNNNNYHYRVSHQHPFSPVATIISMRNIIDVFLLLQCRPAGRTESSISRGLSIFVCSANLFLFMTHDWTPKKSICKWQQRRAGQKRRRRRR